MARKSKAEPAGGPSGETPEPTFAQLWEAVEPGTRTSKGVYSIYKTPEGGMHIAYRPEDTQEDQHFEVPAPLMAMMTAAVEGRGPLGRLRAMAQAQFGG
jgi:hypothetical protein